MEVDAEDGGGIACSEALRQKPTVGGPSATKTASPLVVLGAFAMTVRVLASVHLSKWLDSPGPKCQLRMGGSVLPPPWAA